MSGAANAVKGEAKLGDFVLVFNFNAICALESATGRDAADVFAALQPGPGGEPPSVSFTLFRTLVWAGLQERHPDLSEAAAGNIIQEAGGPQATADALTSALSAMAPEAKAAASPPKAAGGTGSPSSPRGAKRA